MNKLSALSISTMLLASVATQTQAAGRDNIEIVGSSTVYPFTIVAAETFGQKTQFKTPKVESTGSGGGLKLFCEGNGINTPDMTGSSRRIKASEVELCAKNGVTEVTEVHLGFDGIAIAISKQGADYDLTLKDVYLALAKQVPGGSEGELIANPYQTWNEVNSSLPNIKIEVLGPPPTSGTRDAFVELAMEAGCSEFDWIAAMEKADKNKFKEVCHTMREDGLFIEAGENDNLIVQKLDANPEALGIFGFSFLDQNADKVKGASINGAPVTFDNIADGSYPISRPLFMYVKSDHVGKVPGMAEFLAELTDEDAMGEEGYLVEKGLIPLSDDEREAVAEAARNLTPLKL